MKKILLVLLAFALVAGCESSSQQVTAPGQALFTKKLSKKCASNGYAVYGLETWAMTIVDTTVAPPDTVFWEDCGYIFSMARACDALYLATYHGGLMVFDLTDPRHPLYCWSGQYGDAEFHELRISGSNLYARYEHCDGPDGYEENCVAGTAKWNISDPFIPRLIRFTQDR